MALINRAGQEVSAKIVYYGPGLSGKTTNLEILFKQVPEDSRGKMISMKTRTDRTLFFDLLPVAAEPIREFQVRILLYTVPGQVYYNATRRLVLKGVDALVFVADSQRGKMEENLESLENLRSNLADMGMKLGDVPWVIQYNKRDMPDIMSVEELEQGLNPGGVPSFEAVATTGDGIHRTLQGVVGLLRPGIETRLDDELGTDLRTDDPTQGGTSPVEVTSGAETVTPSPVRAPSTPPPAPPQLEQTAPPQQFSQAEPEHLTPEPPPEQVTPEPATAISRPEQEIPKESTVDPAASSPDSDSILLTTQNSTTQDSPPAMATFLERTGQENQPSTPVVEQGQVTQSSHPEPTVPEVEPPREPAEPVYCSSPTPAEQPVVDHETEGDAYHLPADDLSDQPDPLVVELTLSDEQINSRSPHNFLSPDLMKDPPEEPEISPPTVQSAPPDERVSTPQEPVPNTGESSATPRSEEAALPEFTVKIPWSSLESGELNLRIVLTGSSKRVDAVEVKGELVP